MLLNERSERRRGRSRGSRRVGREGRDVEELEDQQGERCGRAIRAYYDCLLEADQGMCMDEEELFDTCASEYARFLNLCYY